MSSGFVTETEALDIRKKRQEEWEKVRTAADPIERPEDPYDNRSLFDRLQEQKQKKDLEYEEAHKLKNMIKGLDDDEIDFLDLVDRTKLAADRQKSQEEEKELNDYRNRVATLQEEALDQKLVNSTMVNKPKVNASTPKRSQHALLQGVVVKKSSNEKKRKLDDDNDDKSGQPLDSTTVENGLQQNGGTAAAGECTAPKTRKTGMQCVGILPGLGYYDNSSTDTSDSESDSDDNSGAAVKMDLLGRKIVQKEETE